MSGINNYCGNLKLTLVAMRHSMSRYLMSIVLVLIQLCLLVFVSRTRIHLFTINNTIKDKS